MVKMAHTVGSPIKAPPLIKVPPVFWGVPWLKILCFWPYLSQKWSDFHSVKSLWKQRMPSFLVIPLLPRPVPLLENLRYADVYYFWQYTPRSKVKVTDILYCKTDQKGVMIRPFQINSLFLVPRECKNLSVSPKKKNNPRKKKNNG